MVAISSVRSGILRRAVAARDPEHGSYPGSNSVTGTSPCEGGETATLASPDVVPEMVQGGRFMKISELSEANFS
jgi:hypothetical protein